MPYIISFLEGIITFISPCLLPMLPVYISYFTGVTGGDGRDTVSKPTVLKNALGFVLGFTVVFVLLGALAGSLGQILKTYSTAVNIVSGVVVIVFGLNFMDLIRLPFLQRLRPIGTGNQNSKRLRPGFFSSILFGMIFSVGWTPCVGTFLGSALMLAAHGGESLKGVWMLLSYSLGLGVPFFLSALLIDRLKSTFQFIKRHYTLINRVAGLLLIVVGILMATGLMGTWLALLTIRSEL